MNGGDSPRALILATIKNLVHEKKLDTHLKICYTVSTIIKKDKMFKIEIHKNCNSQGNPAEVRIAVDCFGQPAFFETIEDAIKYNHQTIRPNLTEYDGVEIVDTATNKPTNLDSVEGVPEFSKTVKKSREQVQQTITHFG
jgi:mevalonate kinase